jgi:RNA 3'-terminal phosphate cyclase
VREISLHARTNIWTAGHFLDARIKTAQERGIFRIESVLQD